MSNQTEFYRLQAATARANSAASDLQNVKDNLLRCADAWDVLAARSAKADQLRAAEAQRKADA